MQPSRALSPTLIAIIAALSSLQAPPRGVWEKLRYDPSLRPTDVFFTTPDEGWLSGSGTILHTTDAGAHWEVQFHDNVGKSGRALHDFHFVDATHGWVIASTTVNATLLRTIDGHAWQAIGNGIPAPADYGFLSDSIGIALVGTRILRSTDAGGSWSSVGDCLTKPIGVPQPVSCTPRLLHLVSPETAYVAAAMHERWMLLRTIDAGATWQPLGADYAGVPEALFFRNADTGYVRLADGFIYGTRDAGSSWQQVAPSSGSRLRFADPDVGWALGSASLTYTINGGATWDTIPSGLSGPVSALSLPRRDRAYAIVGGSLFRYRVVSTDSNLDAAATVPAMPAPESISAVDVKKLRTQALASQSNSSASSHESVDGVLAQLRLLAVKHRNLNLLVDGTDHLRSMLDRMRDVQLRVNELRAASGALARLGAVARLTVALDSLSSVSSRPIQGLPKISIRLRPKHAEKSKPAPPPAAPKDTTKKPPLD